MIDVNWSQSVIRDPVKLTDCIELLVAFSRDAYDLRFNASDFNEILESDIVNEDDIRPLQGETIDDYRVHFEQAVSMVEKRTLWLNDNYPFRVRKKEIHWNTVINPDERHLVYIVLLACSLNSFIPHMKDQLRLVFEEISKIAMAAMFPDRTEVFQFGPSSEDRRALGLLASEAVPKLARLLNTQVISAEEIPNQRRDFGIDIMAVLGFEDAVPYSFFATAQCATGEKWWEKRHEAKIENGLGSFIRINAPHTNFLFIPHFPRVRFGEWVQDRGQTDNCILCDRYRICRLIETTGMFMNGNCPSNISVQLETVLDTLRENIADNSVLR